MTPNRQKPYKKQKQEKAENKLKMDKDIRKHQ